MIDKRPDVIEIVMTRDLRSRPGLSRLEARLGSLGGPGRRRTQPLKRLLAVRGDGCAVPLTVLERKSDRRRDNFMNVRGWIVLRFSWEDVLHDPDYVVEQVRRALGLT